MQTDNNEIISRSTFVRGETIQSFSFFPPFSPGACVGFPKLAQIMTWIAGGETPKPPAAPSAYHLTQSGNTLGTVLLL